MKYLLTSILLFVSTFVFSQNDTVIYFGKENVQVKSKSEAVTIVEIRNNGKQKLTINKSNFYEEKWTEEKNRKTVQFISDTSYLTISYDTILTVFYKSDSGFYLNEFKKGVHISKGRSNLLFPYIKQGNWFYYDWINGELIREEFFSNNKMLSNKAWVSETEYIDNVLSFAEIMPTFKEGTYAKFISDNVTYPKEIRRKGIEGKVFVRFIITREGEVKGARIAKGIDVFLDNESIRVINLMSGKWNPAQVNGENVNLFMAIPIKFQLK